MGEEREETQRESGVGGETEKEEGRLTLVLDILVTGGLWKFFFSQESGGCKAGGLGLKELGWRKKVLGLLF